MSDNLERKLRAIAAAESAWTERNRLLHSSWINVGQEARIVKWARGGRMDMTSITAEEIRQVEVQLRAALSEIHDAFAGDGPDAFSIHGEPPAASAHE